MLRPTTHEGVGQLQEAGAQGSRRQTTASASGLAVGADSKPVQSLSGLLNYAHRMQKGHPCKVREPAPVLQPATPCSSSSFRSLAMRSIKLRLPRLTDLRRAAATPLLW